MRQWCDVQKFAMTPTIKTSNLSKPEKVACPKCDASLVFYRSDKPHIDECRFDTLDLKEAKALLDGLAPWRSRRPGRSMGTTMLVHRLRPQRTMNPADVLPQARSTSAAAEILRFIATSFEKRQIASIQTLITVP